MNSQEKVYQLVAKIPRGKVSTYGAIGDLTNIHPRLVGRILHQNPSPATIPCHRAVNSKGEVAKSFAFGGAKKQLELLEKEGVKIVKNKVILMESKFEDIGPDALNK